MTTDRERPHYAETRYGFEYGAVRIGRIFSHKGRVAIGVSRTDRPEYEHQLAIYVSPTGKSIRVFRGDKELK